MLAPNQVQNYRGSVDGTQTSRSWAITAGVVLLCALATLFLWQNLQSQKEPEPGASETVSLPEAVASSLISLDAQTRIASGVKALPAMATAPAADIVIPGVVEPNQEQLQQITPLVSGRVGRIAVALGDQVRKGDLLVTIDSPQVAELHGKLHEANTRAKLARQNMERVTQSANKVALLKSKATLEETEASLTRISQLVNEGLSARKDLVAAEAEYERAKADFNFQKDISLNREVAEARAALSTAQTEVEHIEDELRALDAPLPNESNGRHHDISAIELHAPISGTVIERLANPGAGFEANKPLLTIANTKRLWVIASVPEGKISSITLGMPARISFDGLTLEGKVNYIDPRLNEDTRTGRVRVEIDNDDNKVKVGSFVEVAFSPAGTVSGTFVPSESIQTVGDRSVVFVEKSKSDFEPRDVVAGKQYGTLVAIKSGLSSGERIATKGAFLLKSKLLKNQLGEN